MERKQNFPSLPGLRGLIMIPLVLLHTMELTPLILAIPLTTLVKTHIGRFCNYEFFIISGFLMACQYRQRIQNREISFGSYLIRRLRGIYPMYLASNLVMLGIFIFRSGISVLDLDELLMMLTLQSGGGLSVAQPYNYPSWFISSLTLCYILYYALTHFSRNKTQYRCAVAVLMMVGYILSANIWSFYFLYTANGFALLGFFLGVLLGDIYPELTDRQRGRLTLASAVILALVCCYGFGIGFFQISSNVVTLGMFYICPQVLILSLACPPVSKVLQWKPFRFLGRISMSVFFWHAPLHELIMKDIYGMGIFPQAYEVWYGVYWVVLILFSCLSEYLFAKLGTRKAGSK